MQIIQNNSMLIKNRQNTESSEKQERKYYKSFDSIKGICIFLVCLCGHYWQFTPGQYWNSGKYEWFVKFTNWITHLGFQTYPAMELLLMLSGFQMFVYYRKIEEDRISFGQYMKQKMVRIFPMTVLGTILMVIGLPLYHKLTGEIWNEFSIEGKYIVENLLNIQSWINVKHTLNGPLWYVSVYFFCLILFYILVRLEKKAGLKYCLMGLMIILGIFGAEKRFEYFLLNDDMVRGYLGFFAGVILAAISEKISDRKIKAWNWIWGGMILIWIVIRFCFKDTVYAVTLQDRVMISMLFLFVPLLLLLTKNSRLDQILGNRILVKLGKISFGLYVLNFPVYLWLAIVEKAFGWNLPYQMDYMFWLVAVLQIVIAFLVYRYYEIPIYKMLNQKKREN